MTLFQGQDCAQHHAPLRLIALITGLGCVLVLMAPRTAPIVLLLCVGASMLWSWLDPATEGRSGSDLTAISVFLLAGAYLLLNASLAFNPQDALVTAAAYLAVVIATILTLRGLRGTSAVALRAMGSGFLAGMGVAALLLCFEFLSGHAIFEAVYAYVPWARLDPKHARQEGSVLHLAGAYLLNRNVSLLMLLLWPCMLVGQSLLWNGSRRLLLALSAVLALAVLISEHETSKLALIASAALFVLFPLQPRVLLGMVAAGWVLINALCIPLAMMAFDNKLYLAPSLPESVAPRLIIWGNVGKKFVEHPIVGIGIGTPRWREEKWPPVEGEYRNLTTSPHSHSIYIQAWYELGAIGALCLCALGLVILRAIGRLPVRVQQFLLPGFLVFSTIGAASFSLWQVWFMASLGLTIVFAGLGAELSSDENTDQVQSPVR